MDNVAITSLLLGLLSTTSPCVLPLYPGFLAYLSGQSETGSTKLRYFLGLFVLAGVLSMMIALGGLIAWLSVSIGRVLAIIIPIADAVILLFGVMLLFDRNPFKSLPQIQVPILRHPLLNAYLYGLLYGPIALPCSGPLLVGIFALSFTVDEALSKLWVFVWFGLGFGLPLLILSLLSGVFQRRLTSFLARHSRIINIFGGLLLIGVAIYDLAQNWGMLQAFWGLGG
jgi:cytochrome c-type biogenesis protein